MVKRAADMEAWAKDNAPWTDRTGAARRELHTEVEENPGTIGTIVIAHGVEHGLWLEIAYGGRWAIITRTIDHWGPVLWKDMQNMVNLGLISVGEGE
jgi:hypothetical protein